MVPFFLFLSFVFGLIVGSFLNVFVARHQTGVSFRGRSFCFSCGAILSWRDLIPIASFLLRKGRCRHCRVHIPWRYPLVEFSTGLTFFFVAQKLIFFFAPYDSPYIVFYFLFFIFYFLVFGILIAIFFYDIRHKIIPNILVYPFIILSLLAVFLIHDSRFIIQNMSAGPLLALPLAFVWFFSRGRWIGLGDVKLTLGIGWLLGLSSGVAAIIIAFWTGGVVGGALLLFNRLPRTYPLFRALKGFTMKSEIPFAPFLIAGVALAFLYDISFADIQSLFI